MSKIKQFYEDKAELALMGKCVPVESEDEVRFITDYILTVLDAERLKSLDIYRDCLHRYNDTNKVTNIGTCRVLGMPCIVYCIDPQDGETPKCLTPQTTKCVRSSVMRSLKNKLMDITTE